MSAVCALINPYLDFCLVAPLLVNYINSNNNQHFRVGTFTYLFKYANISTYLEAFCLLTIISIINGGMQEGE